MKRPHGFTLVEVMVAATLLVLAVASALTLVAHGRRAHRSAEAEARMAENARAALDLLAYEVRMAGYLGRRPPGSAVAGTSAVGTAAPASLAVGGGCVESLALDLGTTIAGADGAYAAAPGAPLACPPSPGGRSIPGSDTLVLRRVSASPTTAAAGRLQLESTRRAARLLADGTTTLGEGAQVNDLEANAYYVSADSTGERGYPSLRRKRLVGGTAPAFQDEELVAGVEDLQVEASIVGGDAGADAVSPFLPLGSLPPDARIHAVRLWVLVRSELPEPLVEPLPSLAYSNRMWPAQVARQRRHLGSRVVEPRNAGGRP